MAADPWAVTSTTDAPAAADPWAVKGHEDAPAPPSQLEQILGPERWALLQKLWRQGVVAPNEAMLGLGSSAVAAPVAGLAGLGSLIPGVTDKPAGDVVRDVQSALTYQPRTPEGETTLRRAAFAPQKYSEATEWLGGKAAEGATALGAPPQVAGAVGAGVKTVGEAAPAALGLRGARGGVAATGARAGAAVDTATAARAAASRAQAAVDASAEKAAASRAPDAPQPLRWTELPAAVQERLTEVAKEGTTLEQLGPEALQRAARLESLDIKATRGQITRSPSQLSTEADLMEGRAGAPLVQLRDAQTAKLHEHLDTLQGKTRARAAQPTQAGKAVVENLQKQAAASKKNVRKLYDDALAAGDTSAAVPLEPVLDLINKAPNPLHLDYIGNKLRRLGMAKQDEAGNWVAANKGQEIDLNNLEEIYKAASAEGKAGGVPGHYAKLVKDRINEITEGAGGEPYRAARAARLEHSKTFENPKIMDRLIDEPKGNRKVALENVWDSTVANGSVADLQMVKKQLLQGRGGPQAWREMQGQTVQFIRDMATKGPPDQFGRRPISGAKFRQALNSIGEEKLNTVFNKPTVNQLYRMADAIEDLTTAPRKPPALGSPTAGKILNWLDRLGKVPGLGGTARTAAGAVKGVEELAKSGAEGAAVREAMRSPLDPTSPGQMIGLGTAARTGGRAGLSGLSRPVPPDQQQP